MWTWRRGRAPGWVKKPFLRPERPANKGPLREAARPAAREGSGRAGSQGLLIEREVGQRTSTVPSHTEALPFHHHLCPGAACRPCVVNAWMLLMASASCLQ